MLEINKIHCGDCLELMKEVESNSADMILCDLPYGLTQNKWDSIISLDELWKQYLRILKRKGIVLLCATGLFAGKLQLSKEDLFKYDLVWEKDRPSGHLNAKKQPMRSHEQILVFYQEPPTYNPIMTSGKPSHSIGKAIKDDKCKNNNNYGDFKRVEREGNEKYPKSFLGTYKRPHPPIHPTQKPLELFKYLIKMYSNEGDLVLDNCMGSGTTALACKQLNRNFIGMELNEDYIELANDKLHQQHFALVESSENNSSPQKNSNFKLEPKTTGDSLSEQDEPSDSEEIKKEIDKDYVA